MFQIPSCLTVNTTGFILFLMVKIFLLSPYLVCDSKNFSKHSGQAVKLLHSQGKCAVSLRIVISELERLEKVPHTIHSSGNAGNKKKCKSHLTGVEMALAMGRLSGAQIFKCKHANSSL